jgi:hypothetical protein
VSFDRPPPRSAAAEATLAGVAPAVVKIKRQRSQRDNCSPSAAQADLRFRADVARLHRAVFELLTELGAQRLCHTEIEQLVGQYAALDPEQVRAVGAGRMPTLPPLRLVDGGAP